MAAKDVLGRRGEELAARYLGDLGYAIVDRNWRCPAGEIDLVVTRGGLTAFVEVKTRSSTGFGHPFEAITVRKVARLRVLAAEWCTAHEGSPRRIRLDAVAVLAPDTPGASIEHLKGIG